MRKFKPDFTINEIGKLRFYSGILIGIGYGFILNFLLQLTTKLSNAGVYLNEQSWSNIINYKFTIYYSILIGFLSVSLAFCFTCYIWMSKPIDKNKLKKRRIRFAQTNSIFIFGVFFLFMFRMFTLFASVDIYVKEYFGFIAFLFPLFIFLYNWIYISKVYKAMRYLMFSFIICVIFGIILSGIKT